MSSILKALKKLEKEKSAHRPDFLNLDTEILRNGIPRSISNLTKILLALLLFVCGSGATYLFMKHEPTAATREASTTASANLQLAPVPPTAAPLVVAEALNIRTSVSKLQHKTVSAATLPERADKPFGRQATQPRKLEHETKLSVVKQPVNMVMHSISDTPPILRVNGIAFQPDQGDSVAIVNGVSVVNGSLIEGVKVENIQKDQVRFSYKGESIDVPLGRANR